VSVGGERFWGSDLDDRDRMVLEVGRGLVDLSPDVLVVGGGILGVAAALACERAGLGSVQLVDASRLGGGATGGSAGLLQPEPHHGNDPASLVELGRASLGRWHDIEGTVPNGVGLVDQDWIGLAPHPEAFARDPPPTVRWLDADQIAELIPGLAVPTSGALIANQARLNPQRALARLAHQLSHVATGVAVTAVTVSGRQVTDVRTTAGTIRPGIVIFATGGPPVVDGLRPAVPADWVKGHMLVSEPTDIRLPGTVIPVAVPIEGGRLLIGGTLDVDDPSPDVRDGVIAGLHAELTAAIPAAVSVGVSHRWCCWRPHHPDGLPVIDQIPDLDNAWLTSGHYRTGLLMGPATADLLVEWITTGHRPNRAAPFAAARFTIDQT
jgi:glycine oxidase